MKTKLQLIGLAALALAGVLFTPSVRADAPTDLTTAITFVSTNAAGTNMVRDLMPAASIGHGLMEIGSALGNATNWDVVVGYGRSTAGGNNVAFAAVNVKLSEYVGAIIGYDYLWNDSASQFNSIKGGVSLSTKIRPFLFLGQPSLDKVEVTPFAADLIATPKDGDSIGNIVTVGFNVEFYTFANFKLETGWQYEKRTGQGSFNGDYNLFHLGIGRRF